MRIFGGGIIIYLGIDNYFYMFPGVQPNPNLNKKFPTINPIAPPRKTESDAPKKHRLID